MHESGQRKHPLRTYFPQLTVHLELNQLTGIAAILTFPLDIEVVEEEEKEEQLKLAAEANDDGG
jgi:stalled ribosome rescue protein Dom34